MTQQLDATAATVVLGWGQALPTHKNKMPELPQVACSFVNAEFVRLHLQLLELGLPLLYA